MYLINRLCELRVLKHNRQVFLMNISFHASTRDRLAGIVVILKKKKCCENLNHLKEKVVNSEAKWKGTGLKNKEA